MSAPEKPASDFTGERTSDESSSAAGPAQDPKNVAELTNYIQSMLQQMQDRL